jgi:hypothetical protein
MLLKQRPYLVRDEQTSPSHLAIHYDTRGDGEYCTYI